MDYINRKIANKIERPIKVMQFGEGNFLRAFADYMIDVANEKGVFDGDIVIVKPTDRGHLDAIKRQECMYTVCLRGMVDGSPKEYSRVVTSVADAVEAYCEYDKFMALAKIDTLRFVISNTTEAGIVYDENDVFDMCPPRSFPGKLTKFLHTRYVEFDGAPEKGLVMLPVELIDDNGIKLKECVMKYIEEWKLSDEFRAWVDRSCIFASTLVDRIVTGYPRDEAKRLCAEYGYRDDLIASGEPFSLWVIEAPSDISNELPLHKANLPVIYTNDHHPYKQRKVRILNGAHTSFSLASYLCGNDYVLLSMEDALVSQYIRETIFDEIIPTLNLEKKELEEFAKDVLMRFANPFVKHEHLSIALNSVSKWRARCLPSLLDYVRIKKSLPKNLTFSLAALLQFYTGSEIRDGALIGHRGNEEYRIVDDANNLNCFKEKSQLSCDEYVRAVLSNEKMWGMNLESVEGLTENVIEILRDIRENGIRSAMEKLMK